MGENIEDENYRNQNCNCPCRDGIRKCVMVDSNCRIGCSIYAISCKLCNCKKVYYGATTRNAKEHVREHLRDYKNAWKYDLTAKDSFVRHMMTHGKWFQNDYPELREIREVTEASIVKKVKPKRLGTLRCTVCAWERYEIFINEGIAMNVRQELYGRCKHKSKLVRPTKI